MVFASFGTLKLIALKIFHWAIESNQAVNPRADWSGLLLQHLEPHHARSALPQCPRAKVSQASVFALSAGLFLHSAWMNGHAKPWSD